MVYFEKSQPAPECLAIEKAKTSGTYRCEGVIERLHQDFKNKCYICEAKGPIGINIEHFVPHQGDINLKFDWDNLFYACSHCNNIKGAKYTNLLNCIDPNAAVDTVIKYEIRPYPKEKVRINAVTENPKIEVVNTIDLLKAVYNGTTPQKKIESNNLRGILTKEIKRFQALLEEYVNDELEEEELSPIRQKIIQALRSASPFAAFKRWIIRDNDYFREEFSEYT